MVISSKGSPGSLTGSAPAQSPALDSAGITPWQCPAWDTGQGMLTHEPEPLHPSQTGAAQGLNPGMGNLPGREKPLSIPSAPAAAAQAPQAVPSSFQALALCDFPPSVGVAAVLRMGEQLRILAEDGEWWLVASEVSGKECHVPSSCVAKIRHGWLYEGVSRQKAEELLLGPGNHSGSFLIRESQSRRGCYSLSLRRGDRATVTHYRIHRLHNGWLYISPGLTFPSLHSLVEHYSEFGEGLCCPLGRPCCPLGWPCSTDGTDADAAPSTPAVGKKPSLHWDKIDSLVVGTCPPAQRSPAFTNIASSSVLGTRDSHNQGGARPGAARGLLPEAHLLPSQALGQGMFEHSQPQPEPRGEEEAAREGALPAPQAALAPAPPQHQRGCKCPTSQTLAQVEEEPNPISPLKFLHAGFWVQDWACEQQPRTLILSLPITRSAARWDQQPGGKQPLTVPKAAHFQTF
ncbi:src-like-adapter 2 isoform X2 [Pithys albifrons albifrons]